MYYRTALRAYCKKIIYVRILLYGFLSGKSMIFRNISVLSIDNLHFYFKSSLDIDKKRYILMLAV
jgi:hypothetical protein